MVDPPRKPAVALVDRLSEAEETVAVAESHTGGHLAGAFVAVPGASDVFREGIVAYVYGTKLSALGVSREILDEHGAVSAETAKAMARGIRDTADATWGIATTGIAGPTGGTDEQPVGTTYIGIAHAAAWGSGESYARAERHVLEGDRSTVIDGAVDRALTALAGDVDDVVGT